MNVSTALRLAKSMGWRWVAFRISYAVKLQSGYLRRMLPVVDWSSQPLITLLKDPSLSIPKRYSEISEGLPSSQDRFIETTFEAPQRCNPQQKKSSSLFFFKPSQNNTYRSFFPSWDTHSASGLSAIEKVEDLKKGVFFYFEHTKANTGFPPNWHNNIFSGQKTLADRHWSRIGDFESGDIKIIWEANRFGFTYALVRAYWRTGNEEYAEYFWRLVEDWKEKNPPQAGVNWKCGQEISIRLMAWLFGLHGFLAARATTRKRLEELAQMLAVSSDRIEKNIAYALSQQNNHGISEALGLWSVGLLFSEFHGAKHWREKGRELLEKLALELIYDDGSFVQHSFNYHRLMLQAYTWAIRLGDLNGIPLSDRLRGRLQKACLFLYQVQDEKTGHVPNYGQNDGALIFPLSNCDYQDYRPAIQAAHYLLTGKRCYPDGPWDEDLLWLFGPAALQSPVELTKRTDLRAETGGYFTIRDNRGSGFAFMRCAEYRHRPGQADMLHADLWWRGINVTLDPGTYSYNAPDPWNNALSRTAFHNTVTVDRQDQMDQVGRFLWQPWLKGKVHYLKRSPKGLITFLEGSHNGYRRLPSPVDHHRGILQLGEESWLVLDRLLGEVPHHYRLHWLFPYMAHDWEEKTGQVTLKTPNGDYHIQVGLFSHNGMFSLVSGDVNSPRGWRSPYYSYREPALSLDLTILKSKGLFWSLFGPESCSITQRDNHLLVSAPLWQADLAVETDRKSSLLSNVWLSGNQTDRLDVI